MLDFGNFPNSQKADVQWFWGDCTALGASWKTWTKPRGCSMVQILLVGAGGGGGDSVAGAASLAAGGGGGGSGAQSMVLIPAVCIPDTLYLSLGAGNKNNTNTAVATGIHSWVSVVPTVGGPVARDTVAYAGAGASGGKSNGNTVGVLGTAGAAAITNMLIAGAGQYNILGGSAGIAGGNASANASNLTLPTTGLCVTGGTGGGGVPTTSAPGWTGGAITGSGFVTTVPGGTAGAVTPTAGGNGTNGSRPNPRILFFTGGTGGGSTGMGASTGLAGGFGGHGAPGCGGGGGGGSFTGQGVQIGGNGGPSFCVITAW